MNTYCCRGSTPFERLTHKKIYLKFILKTSWWKHAISVRLVWRPDPPVFPSSWRHLPVRHHQLHQQLHGPLQTLAHLRPVHGVSLRPVALLPARHVAVREDAQGHRHRQQDGEHDGGSHPGQYNFQFLFLCVWYLGNLAYLLCVLSQWVLLLNCYFCIPSSLLLRLSALNSPQLTVFLQTT